MRVRGASGVVLTAALLVATLTATTGCQRSIFRQYEYEEEIYLKLDGSATIYVNTSIAALVALRGLDLDASRSAPVDRDKIRGFYDSPVARVTRVSPPWRRDSRRYVQIRLDVDDIRQLSRARAFDWSTYALAPSAEQVVYRQVWGAPAGKAVTDIDWDGSELVAVRMHLPSRIDFHNAPSRRVDRGNIVGWEQKLSERMAGQTVTIEVRMQAQSILYRTLTIFGLALAAAVTVMALIVVWVKRRGAPG